MAFEHLYVSYLQERFPGLPEQLVERLGRNMSSTRIYFKYREEWSQAMFIDDGPVEDHDPVLPTVTPSGHPLFDEYEAMSQPSETHYTASVSLFDDVDTMSQVSATNYTAPASRRDENDCISEVSMGSNVDWELVRQNAVEFNRTVNITVDAPEIPDMSVASDMAYPNFWCNLSELGCSAGSSEASISMAAIGPNAPLRFPKFPKVFDDGPAKCPFCFSTIEVYSNVEWRYVAHSNPLCFILRLVVLTLVTLSRRHVVRDLRPYICLSETCLTPNKPYARRVEWADHMRLKHWRLWKCPFGCKEDMHTVEETKKHISSSHKDEVSQHHVDDLAHLCSVPDPSKARGNCLFCDVIFTSDRDYVIHTARHLQAVALFVLPPIYLYEDESDSDEEPESTDSDDASAYR